MMWDYLKYCLPLGIYFYGYSIVKKSKTDRNVLPIMSIVGKTLMEASRYLAIGLVIHDSYKVVGYMVSLDSKFININNDIVALKDNITSLLRDVQYIEKELYHLD